VARIELLGPGHDQERFDCDSETLNRFLAQTARQHMDKGISRTFVLVGDEVSTPKPILGFFTLTVCQIQSEALGAGLAKRLPTVVPGIKLARLAVAKEMQRNGLGKVLLASALSKCAVILETVGGIGLFVDAKNEGARRYYEQFGFIRLPSNDLQLFLPKQTVLRAEG
jgi:GNAT superfamily N-acetyltransferase